ncbi:uncharacterized protein LOC128550019 [Mercenaria mercenaria]|uniref:uncharacterized protein LOC128550019 n=1 Tax=Mercenaria mercenaria TaxID=6596 RepID=UPI00234F5414|nr:uncharacterized protein LOC128550019 [Mercenaria mercenaria]
MRLSAPPGARGRGRVGDNCKADADCAAADLSTCDKTITHKCVCPATHQDVNGQCKTKGLGDKCTANADCVAVAKSICNTTVSHKCECPATHKFVSGQCKPKVIGAVCTAANAATECNLKYSECKNSTIMTCACVAGYHNKNDQCLADSSAESHRIAFYIFGASLLLTVFKTL